MEGYEEKAAEILYKKEIEVMPDRDEVSAGDVVCAVFWDGCFNEWLDVVDDSEEGFFIHTGGGSLGYLKDAYAVVLLMKAEEYNNKMREALKSARDKRKRHE